MIVNNITKYIFFFHIFCMKRQKAIVFGQKRVFTMFYYYHKSLFYFPIFSFNIHGICKHADNIIPTSMAKA